MTQTAFHQASPVYEELAYVLRLEELSGAYISVIGVGPGREQNAVRRDLLA